MNQVGSKADYSTLQSENTVRKISQPVRIAQLLGSSGQFHSSQKNSSIKISQPERITPYLKKISSQKKSVTDACIKWPQNKRSIRRNLTFTEIPKSTMKLKKNDIISTNNTSDNSRHKNLRLSTRESFLVPPNTIKELHIKNGLKQSKNDLPQFHILTKNSGNVNPKISEMSENGSPPVKSTNVNINSEGSLLLNRADSVVHKKKKKMSLVRSISLQTFNVNEQSGINILQSPHLDLADTSGNITGKILENLRPNQIPNIVNIYQNGSHNNECNARTNKSQLFSTSDTNAKVTTNLHSDEVDQNNICCADLPNAEKVEEARTNVEKDGRLSTNIHEEDLHLSLQTVKIISESCLNLQRNTNNDDHVTFRTELGVLASKLKHLIGRLEEDVSELKLTLTGVTNLLSATDVASREIKDNNETEIKQQTAKATKNLNDNVKVMDNAKLPHIVISNFDTNHDNEIFKEASRTPVIRRAKSLAANKKNGTQLNQTYVAFESNKENEEILDSPIVKQRKESESGARRRSARLRGKLLNNLNVSNDSFVNLENELNINMKLNAPLANCTPARNKFKDKKMGRPLQEYMDMKSRLSCLLTPNVNRINPSKSKGNMNCDIDDTKTAVSDKLLAELYNLYESS